jgi:hypothetical protein
MADLIKQSELQKLGLSAEELQEKFKTQLLKDFATCNVEEYLQPISDFYYESIQINISKALEGIMDKSFSSYQQLLYIIDISERHLKEKTKEQADRSNNDVLADLIIKRILQKIVLKKIYS